MSAFHNPNGRSERSDRIALNDLFKYLSNFYLQTCLLTTTIMPHFKSCGVPMCTNTTTKNPNILFIHVPKCPQRRKHWFLMAGRDPNKTSEKSNVFFCEDHFDLPNDMDNYMEYCVMGSIRQIRMKSNCFPTKFQCQLNSKKRTMPPEAELAVIKRQYLTPATSGTTLNSGVQTITDKYNCILTIHTQDGAVQACPKTTSKPIQVCLTTKIGSKAVQNPYKVKDENISPVQTNTTCTSTSPLTICKSEIGSPRFSKRTKGELFRKENSDTSSTNSLSISSTDTSPTFWSSLAIKQETPDELFEIEEKTTSEDLCRTTIHTTSPLTICKSEIETPSFSTRTKRKLSREENSDILSTNSLSISNADTSPTFWSSLAIKQETPDELFEIEEKTTSEDLCRKTIHATSPLTICKSEIGTPSFSTRTKGELFRKENSDTSPTFWSSLAIKQETPDELFEIEEKSTSEDLCRTTIHTTSPLTICKSEIETPSFSTRTKRKLSREENSDILSTNSLSISNTDTSPTFWSSLAIKQETPDELFEIEEKSTSEDLCRTTIHTTSPLTICKSEIETPSFSTRTKRKLSREENSDILSTNSLSISNTDTSPTFWSSLAIKQETPDELFEIEEKTTSEDLCRKTIHAISPLTICKSEIETPSFSTRTKRKLSREENSDILSTNSLSISNTDTSPTFWFSVAIKQETQDELSEIEGKTTAQDLCRTTIQMTVYLIQNNPMYYIGIPKECYFLIQLIQRLTKLPEEHIVLTLKKIRLNTPFLELADQFGISRSYASKIFMKSVPLIARLMHPFIIKSNKRAIKRNLPISLRHKYSNIYCIIDCLEIEIQKPAKSIEQAVTWSECKKANTAKYLISCTPDGFINYVSPGYSGRITDVNLVQDCNFLDYLVPGVPIIAGRGFKNIVGLLPHKDILSKQDVIKTKQIASLGILIEKVVRRLREFSLFKPHSVVNKRLLKYLDDCIVIVCGLINLQDSLIKNT